MPSRTLPALVALTLAAQAAAGCDTPDVAHPATPESAVSPSQPAELRGTPLMPTEGPQPRVGWYAANAPPDRPLPLVIYNGIRIDDPGWVLSELDPARIDSIKVIKGIVAKRTWDDAVAGAIVVFATPPSR